MDTFSFTIIFLFYLKIIYTNIIKIIKNIYRLCFLFCLYLVLLSYTSFGITNGYTIQKIEVIGNSLIESNLLIALSGIQKGVVLDNSCQQIQTSIHKIAKLDGIKSVTIYLSNIDQINNLANYVIHVEEYPILTNYFIEGLSKKDKKELSKKVTIDNHIAISPIFLKNTVTNIKNFFLEKGFRDVQVFTELIPNKNIKNQVILKININKGTKIVVHKITFEGNNFLDQNTLLYNIKELKNAPSFTFFREFFKKIIIFSPFRKNKILLQVPKSIDNIKYYFLTNFSFYPSIFTQEKYLKAKENLILFYRSRGFLDMHIIEERFKIFSDGKLNIYIKLNEGKQYIIGHIKWIGNNVYSDQILNKILNIKKDRIYNPIYIKSRLRPGTVDLTIGDLYTNNGYLFFHADVIETSVNNNEVDLEIRIQEGKQAIINQVDIIGNTLTHDYVIRRTLLTLPGEKYNLSLVRESLRRLSMLKLFKPEKLIPNIQPDPKTNMVDLIYSVEEQPRFECNLNGGYTNEMKIGIGIGSNNFSLRNFFSNKIPIGAAQDLRLNAEIYGKNHKNFSFSFIEPWFWIKENPYILSLNFNSSYKNVFYTTESILDDWIDLNLFPIMKYNKKSSVYSIGGQISLGKSFYKYWNSNIGITYHHHTYQNMQLLEDLIKRSGILHDFILSLSLTYDNIDHPNYPTRGCSWSNFLTITPPYSLLGYISSEIKAIPNFKEFGKFITNFSYFKALLGNFIIHFRGHIGFLHSLSKKNIGPFERFYLGGTSCISNKFLGNDFTSLRGYPDESLTPENYQNYIKGGVLFNKYVIEFRYPIILTHICCYLLGFGEIGDSWLTYDDFNLYNMKKSIGAGIRLMLPLPIIPMIGLDFGHRLDTIKDMHNSKSSFEYHLTFGSTIR